MQTRRLRNEALSDPRFWAMHYYFLLGTDDVEACDLLEPFFGVTEKELDDCWNEFHGAELLNLEVPIRSGFSIVVEYEGDPDPATNFCINHRDWAEPVCLGHSSAHAALPAFRWREVERAVDVVGGIHGTHAFLLCFPAVWITEDEGQLVRPTLVNAWKALAITRPDTIEEMVRQVVANNTVDVQWRQDPNLGWISDGGHSYRNPETRMCLFEEDRYAKVMAFFAGIEAKE